MINPQIMQVIQMLLAQSKQGAMPGGLPNPQQFPPTGVQAQTPPQNPGGPPNPGQYPPTGVPASANTGMPGQMVQGMQGALQGPMGVAQGPIGGAQMTGGGGINPQTIAMLGPILQHLRMMLGGGQ